MISRSAILFAAIAASVAMAIPHPAPASVSSLFDAAFRPAKPRTLVLLVDASGSVSPDDRVLYRQSAKAFAASVAPGDRILVASVGDATRSSFRPALDLVVPRHRARLDQEEALARSSERVRRMAFALIDTNERPQRTRLVETIVAASQAFDKQRAPGDRLLILSDAVEEGDSINLARRPLDVRQIDAALSAARADGLLPDLAGVELAIVGAGGQHYSSVAQFWRRYASATGAQLGQYGRLAFVGGN
jgi:hypothetical protein